jgi:Protein of unknown function (DUF4242)
MPRYLVERTFPEAIKLPLDIVGAQSGFGVADGRSTVSWVHSYVTPDKLTSYCIFDAPSQQAVQWATASSKLPIDRILEVRVMSPYFYFST